MKWSRARNGGWAVAGVALLLAAPAAAQTDGGVRIDSEAAEISIGGRVQTQFNTTTVEDEPESELIVRRARLGLEVRFDERVEGELEVDFAGDRASLKNAYLQLGLSPAIGFRAGKFRRPFSLLEMTSSTRTPVIERGADIRGVTAWDEYELINALAYSDRDVGLQIMGAPDGAPLGLTYAAGVFRGPAHAVGNDATYQYVARATVTPAEEVRIGAAVSDRAFARERPGSEDLLDVRRGRAVEVDLEYGSFAPGVHLMAEVTAGDFDPFAGEEFFGAQAWLAYRTPPLGPLEGLEPAVRVSHGTVDRAAGAEPLGGTLLTPGLNVYLGGRNRVMLNYDFWLARDAADRGSFKAMFQLAF